MSEHNQPIEIIGNVGRDPEMRFTAKGKEVVNINIATHAGKDPDGKDLTAWVRVTFWGDMADKVNRFLKKGSRVKVGGQLKPEIEIFDGKDGQRASYEMTGFVCSILSRSYSEVEITAAEPQEQQTGVPA